MPNTSTPTADIAEQFDASGWRFTPEVAEVFDEHVRASVPFYGDIQNLIAECADWLVPNGGLVADLGCSLGTTSWTIGKRQKGRELRYVLYDEQPSMIKRAMPHVQEVGGVRVTGHALRLPARLLHDRADLTVLAFVLQFMPEQDRASTLYEARQASAGTGALIVAEKIRCRDVRWAEIGNDVSHDYKGERGITDAAIRAKARALRGVLRPLPQDAIMAQITRAGWHAPEVLFRWHQWAVIGAFADE